MVWLTMMKECVAGHHHECPGTIAAPPGEFGGVICECSCHSKWPSRSFEERPPYPQEIEDEFWRAIKNGDDPDDFDLYLKQFPNGRYKELAQQKLAGLRKKT